MATRLSATTATSSYFGRATATGQRSEAITHFTKVSGQSEEDLKEAIAKAYDDWTRRSNYKWRIDVGYEPLAAGLEERLNQLHER